MLSTVINGIAAMAILIALSLFFVGFVLAIGYVIFTFAAPGLS